MHLARYLVQGVDVWLNVPRRLQEASGTSGMKACLNGVIHLSVPDGWWHEGLDDGNGWAIGDDTVKTSAEEEDRSDAEALYRLLEEKIVPLYYERTRTGLPRAWVAMMKRSISTIVPVFSARRMLKEYFEKLYLPALTPDKVPSEARVKSTWNYRMLKNDFMCLPLEKGTQGDFKFKISLNMPLFMSCPELGSGKGQPF